MSAPKLAYRFEEAAHACGVSVDIIRRAVRRGDLAVKYPTARPVIEEDELKAWLKAAPSERKSA